MLKLTLIILTLICPSILSLEFEECKNAEPDSFVAIANDCRAFIYCAEDDESSFQDICPEDTYFNAEEGECQIDVDNICLDSNIDNMEEYEVAEITTSKLELEETFPGISSTISPTTSLFVTTLSTIFEHTPLVATRPKCVRNLDSYYPHYQRCEYYFKCISGYLTILRCNFNHAWDYQREMCVPFNMVRCYGKSRFSSKLTKKSKWLF
ncbi:uncharacterized protein ACRADG_001934 [Cochliomyia hominivorax]